MVKLASLALPLLALPRRAPHPPHARMQIFPSDDLSDTPVRVTIREPLSPAAAPSRSVAMASLLSELLARPDDVVMLLEAATPMLLAPFQPDAPQEEGSIFTDASLSVAEKMDVYQDVLDARIGSASSPNSKRVLRAMRDHVLLRAGELRDAGGPDAG